MSVSPFAIKAYTRAMQEQIENRGSKKNEQTGGGSFTQTLADSLTKVNQMEIEKESMVTAFASGENQNVHEVMISLQKAGLAMSVTSAVRNKIMDAYKELMRMSF